MRANHLGTRSRLTQDASKARLDRVLGNYPRCAGRVKLSTAYQPSNPMLSVD